MRCFPLRIRNLPAIPILVLTAHPCAATGTDNTLGTSASSAVAPQPSPNPSILPDGTELTRVVFRPRNPVQLLEQPSQTEVSRETLDQLPARNQKTLQKLLSETAPSAVEGPLQRVFLRQNEFGIRYQVDGILLPEQPSTALSELLALRDIQSMNVITGALPAEYGERIQSLVDIRTVTGPEKLTGEAEVNYGTWRFTSPQVALGGSSTDGAFHYSLTGNYHRTDRGLGVPDPLSERDQTQAGPPVHDLAVGNNEFAKLDWTVSNLDQLSFLVSNSQDLFQIPNYPSTFSPTDSFFQSSFTDLFGNIGGFNYTPASTNDAQLESNELLMLSWKHTLSERSRFELGSWLGYSLTRLDNDPSNDLFSLGTGGNPTSLALSRHTDSAGLQGDYTVRPDDRNRLQAGFRVSAQQVTGDILLLFQDPGNQGNVLATTDSAPERGWIEGVYVQDEFQIIPNVLLVSAGLRFDALQYDFEDAAPRYAQLQPRINLSYLPFPGTKLHAFFGRMFLPAPLEDLHATFTAVSGAGALAPYDIQPETDSYLEVGLDQRVSGGTAFKLTAYYKDAAHLLDDSQVLNTPLEQSFNWDHGYAYGFEAALRGALTTDLNGYVNYSYGSARGEGLSGGAFVFDPGEAPVPGVYQALDHVQKGTLNSGLIYSTERYWGSVEGLYGSGLPTGPNNSSTLPAHLTFNLGAGYTFRAEDRWWSGTKISADLLNVFDMSYPISVANGFNGSYYAPGRELMVHLAREF